MTHDTYDHVKGVKTDIRIEGNEIARIDEIYAGL